MVLSFWMLGIAGIALCAGIGLFTLLVLVLIKYLRTTDVRHERAAVCRSLGEALRERRTACKMTQEFVAQALGVSRQAVSKWERGTADPSTGNLLALAKLYGVPPEELLRAVTE